MTAGLWQVQRDALDWIEDHPRSWLEVPMGGGKSRIAIEALRRHGYRRVLVLCPARVVDVWSDQLNRWGGLDHDCSVLEPGTPLTARTQTVRDLSTWRGGRATVAVTNYEALLDRRFLGACLRWDPDLVVCDESQRLKGQGRTFRAARKLAGAADERAAVAMSGTVMPHSPLDAWTQANLVVPGTFPGTFSAYRNTVAVMGGPHQNWVTGFRVGPPGSPHHDREVASWLAAKLAEVLFQGEIDHGIGLVSTFRIHDLPADVRSAYDRLERDSVLELAGGHVAPKNTLVLILRLAQIASGYLPLEGSDPSSIYREHIGHDERQAALLELLEDVDEPVVVGCRFQNELAFARESAYRLGRSYGEISGRRSDGLTAQGRHAGQQVLGVQYQAGGVGIDLSAASIAVLAGHTYSLGDYDQFIGRLRRPGQEASTVRVVHLLASETVDLDVYRAIEARRSVVDAVTTAMKERAAA